MFQANPLVHEVISCAIAVHRAIGPGLLESAYECCLRHEMTLRKIRFVCQVALPVNYRGLNLDCGYRLDFLVEGQLVLELKCVETVLPIHEAQVLTYLRLSRAKQALLINFNAPRLVDGLKSFLARPIDLAKSDSP
jgi:GxxExxY protein